MQLNNKLLVVQRNSTHLMVQACCVRVLAAMAGPHQGGVHEPHVTCGDVQVEVLRVRAYACAGAHFWVREAAEQWGHSKR